MKWRNRTKLFSTAAVEKLCGNFSSANIGILTGLSGLTVVDCDAPDAVAAMIERCGDTPLKVATPSGGAHLYYRSDGERCTNLRAHGLEVDIKGIGGFVVVPPSVRPAGPYAGQSYGFLSGSWVDLGNLPTIRPGGLTMTMHREAGPPTRLPAIKEGRRNNTLFRALLRHAGRCDTEDDLQEVANTINSNCDPPLPSAKVRMTARSAWRYEQTGRNWVGREAKALVTASEHQILAAQQHGADALLLLTKLRLSHGNRTEFCAAPRAMARAKILPLWGPQRYRNALATLVQTGRLRIVHRGGRSAGDARRYVLPTGR